MLTEKQINKILENYTNRFGKYYDDDNARWLYRGAIMALKNVLEGNDDIDAQMAEYGEK